MISGREFTGIARLVFTGDLVHNQNYEIVRTLILSVHLYLLEYVEIIGKPPKELNGKEEMSLPPAISAQIDFGDVDFSVAGFIQTDKGGTIISKTIPGKAFLPNGKTLYVDADGKLVFEVGLVNNVRSKNKVNDGDWHEFGLVHSAAEDRLVIYWVMNNIENDNGYWIADGNCRVEIYIHLMLVMLL
jgi:hypothetical protein